MYSASAFQTSAPLCISTACQGFQFLNPGFLTTFDFPATQYFDHPLVWHSQGLSSPSETTCPSYRTVCVRMAQMSTCQWLRTPLAFHSTTSLRTFSASAHLLPPRHHPGYVAPTCADCKQLTRNDGHAKAVRQGMCASLSSHHHRPSIVLTISIT